MKKSFLFMLCLVAVSLSACKKHAPVASQETCSNEYLEKHPDLQKFFESDATAFANFEQSCSLVERMAEAKREKALKALMVTARTLTTGETCSEGYVKNHPEFLKDHLPIAKSDSDLLNTDDVRSTFSQACYNFEQEREEKEFKMKQSLRKSLRKAAVAVANEETCLDTYLKSHPQFLKDHLPIAKSDSGLISEDDVKQAFRSACWDFENAQKQSIQAEARATVTKEMCSANYLKDHPEILKAHPRLTKRGPDGMLDGSYTYFGQACCNLGVCNGNADIWIDNKYNIPNIERNIKH